MMAAHRVWDGATCAALIADLSALRQTMLAGEAAWLQQAPDPLAQHQASARNLWHYTCLRRSDLRHLQEQLASLGLSSLGRSQSHVLANVDKVLGVLHQMVNQPWQDLSAHEPSGRHHAQAQLLRNADALLGPATTVRQTRIMVTLSSTCATDFNEVLALAQAGMDLARINTAHDSAGEWAAMVAHVRQAARSVQRPIKVVMDLAGPKLRTTALNEGPAVVKIKPNRDAYGRVYEPGRVRLVALGAPQPATPATDADVQISVWADWLTRLKVGDTIGLTDARGAKRHMIVAHKDNSGAVAECLRTTYLTPQTQLSLDTQSKKKRSTLVCGIPPQPLRLTLHPGDALQLTHPGAKRDGSESTADDTDDAEPAVPRIGCSLPEVFDHLRVGQSVWFDDGRLGGVVETLSPEGPLIRITTAAGTGEHLGPDKGINLPQTDLPWAGLTAADRDALAVMASDVDAVGLSFIRTPDDVDELRQALLDLERPDLGIILKIETRQAFEQLPGVLRAALAWPVTGVMIARGDLAIECGYDQLAAVQEDILNAAEAAHMPVVWATQVLDQLARTGTPTRAELSDAALAARSECVMLNKGPHVCAAIHTLDNVLRQTQSQQQKNSRQLPRVAAWQND